MNSLVVYKASAGSGKTFRLAVEYIKLLVIAEEPDEYAHILAVTFTNKATAEMKDRILSQLYGIGHGLKSSEPYFNELKKALSAEPGISLTDAMVRDRCRRALTHILHDYSRFRVQTIDAFFQTVLRGLAHELGLTANLQVEISDAEVLSKAVDRIVDRLQDDPQVFEWLLSLVRERIDNDRRWDVRKDVKNFGRAIFNEDFLMRGERLRQVLSDTPFMRQLISDLQETEREAVDKVKSLGERLDQTVYGGNVTYSDFSNGHQLRSFADHLKDGDIFIEPSARVKKWAYDPLSLVKKSDQQQHSPLLDVADEVSSVLDDILRELDSLQYDVNSARLALAHLKPLCLLDAIDREVAQINAETSRFNLAKTPILLSRMVGESDSSFVFEKIGAQLHHVMIDEFQDTSRLQWHNFRTLLLESYAKGGRNMLVGDVKQSIYRWRGGDWRVLGEIEKTMEPTPLVKFLDVNRRSARRIIDFNNDFFKKAALKMDEQSKAEILALNEPLFFETAYADVNQKVPADKATEGMVRISVLSPETYKKREDWEPVVLEDMKEQMRLLHAAGVAYSKMTILVRNNSDMGAIIDSFADDDSWTDRPMIVSDEAFMLSSSPAVNVLISALRLLDKPEDKIAEYYLRTMVSNLPPDGLDAKLSELPLYELLETLYLRFHLDEMANQDSYIFAFFDAVVDFLRSESSDIHAFLTFWEERLRRQAIPAGTVDGIRIITIHKSKGLQFDTVFMPFCTWAFERDRSTDLIWCVPKEEPFSHLQLLPITPNSRMAPKSAFARDYAETHLLSRLDELNALYVGFTRPESNLYAWAVGNADRLTKSKRTVGDLIAAVFSDGCEIGEALVKADGGKKEHDNRLEPSYKELEVKMKSYPMGASFRQSNRSQQFIASLSEADTDIAASEQVRASQYIEIGRLLHSVLQSIETVADVGRVLDSLEQEGVIVRHSADGNYVSIKRTDLERWIAKGLKNPLVANWFSGEWKLFNECSILSVNPESHKPEIHRPDRVMVSADGKKIVVVDFKSGSRHEGYDAQVREYMKLLSSMHPQAKVAGYLWFVNSGRVDPVNAEAPSQLTLDF